MARLTALLVVVLAGATLAQSGPGPGDTPDPAMIPDASAGQGGAQQGTEESDASKVCMSDADCGRSLRCERFKCVWRQYRQATFAGCGARHEASSIAVGTVVLEALRRIKRRLRRDVAVVKALIDDA